MVWMDCMVHRWYIDGTDELYHTQMVKKKLRKILYHTWMVWAVCMVHRWYIDGMQMVWTVCMVRKDK